MRASAEHRARHDVDERLRIQSTLSEYSNGFSEHLQRGRAHHVAEQFDEVCFFRVGADHKSALSETVEDRLAALDIGRDASGDDEQLARLGSIRISEHRRSYVALSVPRMLAREQRRGRRADRAHRQMDRAGHQTRGQTVETISPRPNTISCTASSSGNMLMTTSQWNRSLISVVGLRPSASSLPI